MTTRKWPALQGWVFAPGFRNDPVSNVFSQSETAFGSTNASTKNYSGDPTCQPRPERRLNYDGNGQSFPRDYRMSFLMLRHRSSICREHAIHNHSHNHNHSQKLTLLTCARESGFTESRVQSRKSSNSERAACRGRSPRTAAVPSGRTTRARPGRIPTGTFSGSRAIPAAKSSSQIGR
jgi:hypothetical protein